MVPGTVALGSLSTFDADWAGAASLAAQSRSAATVKRFGLHCVMTGTRRIDSNTPGWLALAAIAGLVLAVHVLVLLAMPAQLALGPEAANAGDASGKSFSTRSIQAKPIGQAPVTPTSAATFKPPKKTEITPKNTSNQLLANEIPSQEAPEIIAIAEPLVSTQTASAQTSPATAVETAVVNTPTLASPITAPSDPSPQTAAITAVSLPSSVRLKYKVTGTAKNLNYQADAELAWNTNGDSY